MVENKGLNNVCACFVCPALTGDREKQRFLVVVFYFEATPVAKMTELMSPCIK